MFDFDVTPVDMNVVVDQIIRPLDSRVQQESKLNCFLSIIREINPVITSTERFCFILKMT
jgi:hypothetical protein